MFNNHAHVHFRQIVENEMYVNTVVLLCELS